MRKISYILTIVYTLIVILFFIQEFYEIGFNDIILIIKNNTFRIIAFVIPIFNIYMWLIYSKKLVQNVTRLKSIAIIVNVLFYILYMIITIKADYNKINPDSYSMNFYLFLGAILIILPFSNIYFTWKLGKIIENENK